MQSHLVNLHIHDFQYNTILFNEFKNLKAFNARMWRARQLYNIINKKKYIKKKKASWLRCAAKLNATPQREP